MTFLNSLTALQWTILGLVPPLIISLYFLKLKRMPLEVPSTYLWSRTIEDLHVNSIWQRLRQSLLLFLQLLVIVLLVLALLRPGWKGAEMSGDRFIFLIDNSASMSATDINGRSRLEESLRRISTLLDEMPSGAVGMIVTFADDADVVQNFTDDKRLLKRQLKEVKPTNRATDPQKALRYAAGLANPGRTSNDDGDVQTAQAMPAKLYIFSDGGFAKVEDFSLGNLDPEYVPIGSEAPHNVGIVAFSADRNPERPDQLQAFARIENGGQVDAEVAVTLRYEGNVVDSQRFEIPAGAGAGATFPLSGELAAGVLTAELETSSGSEDPYNDNMEFDNIAYAPVNPPRLARLLLISPGSEAWELALGTERVQQLASVDILNDTSVVKSETFVDEMDDRSYDLIIFDNCSPDELPNCNTLFMGQLPPGDDWKGEPFPAPPQVLDTDRTHPLMQMLDMTGLLVAEGLNVKPPPGGSKLMDADLGTMLAIAPRRAYTDAVLGFSFYEYKDGKATAALTNWHTRPSFPVFVMNVVKYLGGSRGALAMKSVKPGKSVTIRSLAPVSRVRVKMPSGEELPVGREALGTFQFSNTQRQGVYDVFEGAEATEPSQRFAVNLFDLRESTLGVEPMVKIEHDEVVGERVKHPVRRELWKWVLLAGLALLTFEWYVYNRRVYL